MSTREKSIIDVHAHVGTSLTLSVGGDAKQILEIMDDNDIIQSVISPIPGYEDPDGIKDAMLQNNNIADMVKKWPDRFPRGLGVVEPRHGSRALPEVDRIFEELNLAGLMFHNDFNGVYVDHPSMHRILERAAKYKNAIVMIHTFQHSVLETPFQLLRIAERFPEITFIDGHPMMTGPHLSASIDLAQRCTNVYFDICLTHHHEWPIERAVKEIGADRLLFGSDIPYYTKCMEKVIVENALISAEDKEKILYKNAAKLFSL